MGYLPDGIDVLFDAGVGSVQPPAAQTADGQAATTFSAGSTSGTDTVQAQTDNETVDVLIDDVVLTR